MGAYWLSGICVDIEYNGRPIIFDDGNLGVIATAGLQFAVLLYMATLSLMRRAPAVSAIKGSKRVSPLLWLISLTTFVIPIWWLPAGV